jgi:hypothetical protein
MINICFKVWMVFMGAEIVSLCPKIKLSRNIAPNLKNYFGASSSITASFAKKVNGH